MSLVVMVFRIRETINAMTIIPMTRNPGAAASFPQYVSNSFMDGWDRDYTTHLPPLFFCLGGPTNPGCGLLSGLLPQGKPQKSDRKIQAQHGNSSHSS